MSHETNADLEEILESTVSIPTIPSTLLKLREVCENESSDAADIAAVIEQDPAIAAKVLRLVNSSFYALSAPCNSISGACTILGQRVISNLVLQATVLETFSAGGSSEFDLDKLWDHSFKVAVATQQLVGASALGFGLSKDDAYTCGLMHDIGKILIQQSLPEKFAEVLRTSRERGTPLFEAERSVLGFTHAEAGALLSEQWQLSTELRHAIYFHHSGSTESDMQTLGLLVNAANKLAHEAATVPPDWIADPGSDDVFEQLAVPAEALDEIRSAVAAASLG